MTNDLVVQDFETQQRQAMALAKSGYFSDVKSEAQAIVKVMAGAELGLPPFASMSGIHIIKGKPALGANVMATLIKNDPRYDYRVTKMERDECSIDFYENGQKIGTSSFTLADAKAAGTQNLAKFARNMLFARAISNGARWYTPGIFGGSPVYTPEELGAQVDEEGYIDADSIVIESPSPVEEPADQKKTQSTISGAKLKQPNTVGSNKYNGEWNNKRPELVKAVSNGQARNAHSVQEGLVTEAGNYPDAPSEKQLKATRASLSKIGTNKEVKSIMNYVFGIESSNDLTKGMCMAFMNWIGANAGNGWQATDVAKQEAQRLLTADLKAKGQQELI